LLMASTAWGQGQIEGGALGVDGGAITGRWAGNS